MTKIEQECEGPYCTPETKEGKFTGKVVCPFDCPLCGINGDSIHDDDDTVSD